MIEYSENLNLLWSRLIIEELMRNGINYFCISPGSRSTPLTVAVSEQNKAIKKVFIDERGAAFHAIGYAKGSGKAAVLICTSGTALANYFPALIEAASSHIPLIILNADRPPELRNTMANQTIDQVKIFGQYVNWFFDMPCPTTDISAAFVLSRTDKLVEMSNNGLVHLNCMFREPLAPIAAGYNQKYTDTIRSWLYDAKVYKASDKFRTIPPANLIRELTDRIKVDSKGLIIAGELANKADQMAVIQLAGRLNWPLFADFLSGILPAHKSPAMIKNYNRILAANAESSELKPDIVLHFGGRAISKDLQRFLSVHKTENFYLIDRHADVFDPGHLARFFIQSDIDTCVNSILESPLPETTMDWLKIWQQGDEIVHEVLNTCEELMHDLNEISVVREISAHIPAGWGLFAANSMPVRDFDSYGHISTPEIRQTANRGTSGIDGNIATAIGFSNGIKKPVIAVIGDLAVLHDLNSLLQLKNNVTKLVLVIINNFGGGIFSFLPISEFKEYFEQYFAAAHNQTFEKITESFGLDYFNPKSLAEFVDNLNKAVENGHHSIIEVNTDRNQNADLHKQLDNKLRQALEQLWDK